MPLALYALTAGAFGIGVTEFVIMGLLLNVRPKAIKGEKRWNTDVSAQAA